MFVPLKYSTLSSQLQRLTSFSVGCSGRRILSPGQIAVMRKWSIPCFSVRTVVKITVCCLMCWYWCSTCSTACDQQEELGSIIKAWGTAITCHLIKAKFIPLIQGNEKGESVLQAILPRLLLSGINAEQPFALFAPKQSGGPPYVIVKMLKQEKFFGMVLTTLQQLLNFTPLKLFCDPRQWRSHWGGKGGRVPPLMEKNAKNWEKEGKKSGKVRKNREKRGKSGRKGKNREVSFTLPLLTDRAGYATDPRVPVGGLQKVIWQHYEALTPGSLLSPFVSFE